MNNCDHSECVSKISWDAHLASNAIPCQNGCLSASPPWLPGFAILSHDIRGIFLEPSLLCPHKKSWHRHCRLTACFLLKCECIRWYVGIGSRIWCIRISFPANEMCFNCQLEMRLLTLLTQKFVSFWGEMCTPIGAPRYFRMSPDLWIVHPLSKSHWGAVDKPKRVTADFWIFSFAPDAYSYRWITSSSSWKAWAKARSRTPRSSAKSAHKHGGYFQAKLLAFFPMPAPLVRKQVVVVYWARRAWGQEGSPDKLLFLSGLVWKIGPSCVFSPSRQWSDLG